MSVDLAVGIAVGNMMASSAPAGPMTPMAGRATGAVILFIFLCAGVGAVVKRDRLEGAIEGTLVGLLLTLLLAAVVMVVA